jgi:hypothetical protein
MGISSASSSVETAPPLSRAWISLGIWHAVFFFPRASVYKNFLAVPLPPQARIVSRTLHRAETLEPEIEGCGSRSAPSSIVGRQSSSWLSWVISAKWGESPWATIVELGDRESRVHCR